MQKLKRHIYLIGLPGTGKSTLGRSLVGHGLRFIDLDDEVESHVGMTIADLVAERGMAAMRAIETECLRRVAADTYTAVVATGGGTPCQPGNMDLMLDSGLTVWLTCERQRHIRRLCEGGAKRPMLAKIYDDPAAVDALISRLEAERSPHYSRAELRFDASRLEDATEIAASVQAFMQLLEQNISG